LKKNGEEAAMAFGRTLTPQEDVSRFSARIGQKAGLTDIAKIEKASVVEEMLLKSRRVNPMVKSAMDASAAVAGGIAKSGLLRDAAAAATILGKRF
jgi:hypothetical protein